MSVDAFNQALCGPLFEALVIIPQHTEGGRHNLVWPRPEDIGYMHGSKNSSVVAASVGQVTKLHCTVHYTALYSAQIQVFQCPASRLLQEV